MAFFGIGIIFIALTLRWFWVEFCSLHFLNISDAKRVVSVKRRFADGLLIQFIELDNGEFRVSSKHIRNSSTSLCFMISDREEGENWRDNGVVPVRFKDRLQAFSTSCGALPNQPTE